MKHNSNAFCYTSSLKKKGKKTPSMRHFCISCPPSDASSMSFSPMMCYNQPLPPYCLDRRNKQQVTSPGEEYMIGGKEEKKECFAKLWVVTYFVSLPWQRVLFQSAWFAGLVIHWWRTCFRKFTSLDPINLGSLLPSQNSIALRVNNPQSWLPWTKNKKCVHH